MIHQIMNRSEILHFMQPGVKRREAILKMLASEPNNYIVVNRKYCPLLKFDRDLRYLLKKGKLVRSTVSGAGFRNTYTIVKLPL